MGFSGCCFGVVSLPKDFGVLPAPCDFGAVVAEASAGVVSFLGTFALASKTFAAAGGATRGFAAGTEAGTPIKAAFFWAGSSVVALATGLGGSAFAFGSAGLGDSTFGGGVDGGLGVFAFSASVLGDAFGASAFGGGEATARL